MNDNVKRYFRCNHFVLGTILWILTNLVNATERTTESQPAPIASMLATIMLVFAVQEHQLCLVRVLPDNSDDLILKAALHPECTLLVSGTYQVPYPIPLYGNKIVSIVNHQSAISLPKANSSDLVLSIEDGDSGYNPPEKNRSVKVGAVFVPAEHFSGTHFFKHYGNIQFQHIGFYPPVNIAGGFNLTAAESDENFAPEFIDVGQGSPETCAAGKLPEILQWGKGRHQKSYSRQRQGNKHGHTHQRGRDRRQRLTRSKKGLTGTGGDKPPPKRPRRWDLEEPNVVDELTVTIILQLISEILAGQNVEKNLTAIREMLASATPSTCARLMKNSDFQRVNNNHHLLVGYSIKTVRR